MCGSDMTDFGNIWFWGVLPTANSMSHSSVMYEHTLMTADHSEPFECSISSNLVVSDQLVADLECSIC